MLRSRSVLYSFVNSTYTGITILQAVFRSWTRSELRLSRWSRSRKKKLEPVKNGSANTKEATLVEYGIRKNHPPETFSRRRPLFCAWISIFCSVAANSGPSQPGPRTASSQLSSAHLAFPARFSRPARRPSPSGRTVTFPHSLVRLQPLLRNISG